MIQSVLIDQREPRHIQSLDFGGVPTVVTLLDYGDLHVLCDDNALLVIERKTPDDLLGSIADGRLMNQMAGIRQMSQWAYLVIDGQLRYSYNGKVITDKRDTEWTWASVQGALLTVQEIGVSVIHSNDFEKTIIWLEQHSRSSVMKVYPKREAIFATPAEQVLASLPGIGEQRATSILSNHAGNLKWALCSLLDPTWEKQPDIGAKTKDNLRKLFSMESDEILWPYTNDQPNERITTK